MIAKIKIEIEITDEMAEKAWVEEFGKELPELRDWMAEIGKNNPISWSCMQLVTANNPPSETDDSCE